MAEKKESGGRIGFAGSPSGINDGFWEFYHKPIDGQDYSHNNVVSNLTDFNR